MTLKEGTPLFIALASLRDCLTSLRSVHSYPLTHLLMFSLRSPPLTCSLPRLFHNRTNILFICLQVQPVACPRNNRPCLSSVLINLTYPVDYFIYLLSPVLWSRSLACSPSIRLIIVQQ